MHTKAADARPVTTASHASTAPPADRSAAFHDPGVQFGLRFDQMQEGEEKGAAQAGRPAAGAAPTPLPAPTAKPEPATPSDEPKTAQVVNLESFRKK